MFTLRNTSGDDVLYLKALVEAVEKEQKFAKSEITSNRKEVTVQLVHEYQVDSPDKNVAFIRYSTTEIIPNARPKCESTTTNLIQDENYDFNPLDNLLAEVVKYTNEHIDMAVMCGGMVEPDDIQLKAQQIFITALRSVGVYWEYNVSAIIVNQQLSKLIATVC